MAFKLVNKIELGNQVKDRVTGFEGVVVARSEWLGSEMTIGIQAKQMHDGKPVDLVWLSEKRLEVIQ